MSKLNYRHLYYFWRIAVVGKLTQVANELHISQSALSAQIKQLEHQIGHPLFDRKNRKLSLTDEGKKILQYAEDIFSIGNELERLISEGVPAESQHLSMGVLNNLSRNFVEGFINPLLKKQNVTFTLETRGLENLIRGLENHDFDLILTNCTIAGLSDKNLWQTALVAQQPVAIVGPPGKKPASQFPDGYQTATWVLPGAQTEIRSAFESWCTMRDYKANIKSEADDMAMLRLLTRDSSAFAVLPPVVVKDEINQGLLEVYEEIPNAFENFYAITGNKKYRTELISLLLNEAAGGSNGKSS